MGGGQPEGDGLPEHLPVQGLQRGLLLQRLEQHGPCVTEIIFVTYPLKNLNLSHQKHCQNDNHCKECLISY